MAQRKTSFLLALAIAFSVVISHVVPHHHHHGDETIICVADDLHDADDCSGDDHSSHSGCDDCCGLKNNLIVHSGDSRKEDVHCDCGGNDFHAGHFFILLAPIAETLPPTDDPLLLNTGYRPYSNLYLSVLAEGHIGLRAPPVA